MILLDLLTSAEVRTRSRRVRWPSWVPVLGFPAMLVAALVPMAWWSWTLRAEAAGLSQALADAEAVLRSLAPAVDDARDAEARRADLRGRLTLIEELHQRRDAAVQMLDRLSRGLPDDLWFSEVREETGVVVVRGFAATLTSVSDYAAALEATGAFGAPVEVIDFQRGESSDGKARVRFEFRMSLRGGRE